MKILNKFLAIIVIAVFTLGTIPTTRAATTINLGTADHFAVLAGSGINNTGATTITGDMGTHPTLTETGFGTILQTGTNHIGDTVTQTAKSDLDTAYGLAAASPSTSTIVSDLGGQTLAPGVYTSGSSIGITGTVTLDGAGDPNAVFIFQAGSTLTTGSSSHVSLINGAQACNVFWQIGSSATFGTGTDFYGNILAFSSITDNSGSTVHGRLLARGAAVTLNNTTVTKATCTGLAPATLNVVKHIIGNTGDSASNFTLSVAGTSNISPASFTGNESGTSVTLDPGSYAVDENTNAAYTREFSADCFGTINAGETKNCTVTDTYIRKSNGPHSPFLINPTATIVSAPVVVFTAPTQTIAINPIITTPPASTIVPALPNTGYPTKGEMILNNIISILGIVFLASTSTFLILKKNKV